MAIRARKLYFYVGAGANVTGSGVILGRNQFICTQGLLASNTTPGDMYGALLAPLDPVAGIAGGVNAGQTDTQIARRKAANEVSAFFRQTFTTNAPNVGPSCGQATPVIEFMSPYTIATVLPYLTVGGVVAAKAGVSAVGFRHFAVRVRFPGLVQGNGTIRGVLSVQRQHSVEV